MSETESFGRWLRARRRALDLTQEELARRVGCAPITVRKLEADEMRPSKSLAESIAAQLGIREAERDAFVRFARSASGAPPSVSSSSVAEQAPWHAPTPGSDLPSGTVTLLFSDIVGSTRLVQQLGDGYTRILSEHQRLLRSVYEKWNGHEIDTEGDAFFAVFARAGDAANAAVEAQRALARYEWPERATLRVRMALHTGEPTVTSTGYVGIDVHRAARICAAADGGQVLLSNETRVLVEGSLPQGLSLLDLGKHRLKDLPRPEHLFQLVIPGLQSSFQPLRTLGAQPTNLPQSATPFLGREKETASVRELLQRKEVRLVTLTGAGGSGKTRLALQVGAELLEHPDFQDGLFFVPLASIQEPALVILTLAQVVGVRETVGSSVMEAVTEALRDKRMLVVLDNFEQVVSAAPLIAELLGACARLKILVTSREALHLRGEREFPVPPLSLPDLKNLPGPEALSQYAAVGLFVQRAIAVKPSFRLTEENAAAVAEICSRVDGLPLAIELAAARVKLLPPQAMLKRLEHRLTFLTGGARDLPARQQTLRHTIDWSYDLLNDRQKVLLDRLSVFVGGCTYEAVEAVCNADSALDDVLDLLSSLIDQSLLRQDETGDEARFTMLGLIREYAQERLADSGDLYAVGPRHAQYYLALAEQADPLLETPQQATALERLQNEYENLRAALDWFAERGEAEPGLRLGTALWRFWEMRGYLTEGRARLAQMLELPQARGKTKARMKALYAAGVLADAQCDYPTARQAFEEELAISRELNDPWARMAALNNLGNVHIAQGEYERAQASYAEALQIARQVGEPLGIAWGLKSLAIVALHRGDYPAARSLYEEALEMWKRVQSRASVAVGYNDLGNVAAAQGEYPAARSAYEQSLLIFRELGNEGGEAMALHNLGNVASVQGDYTDAHAYYAQSLRIAETLGDKRGLANSLESFANLAILQEQAERAVLLAGAADVLRAAIGAPLAPAEQAKVQHTLAMGRRMLTSAEYAAAWARGQGLTLEEAIVEARANSP